MAALHTASMPFERPRKTKKMLIAATNKNVQTIECMPPPGWLNRMPFSAAPVICAKKLLVTSTCWSIGRLASMPMPSAGPKYCSTK